MSKSEKAIKNTIRKCVQERKIDPNPTHEPKFDKNIVNETTIRIGPELVFRVFFYILLVHLTR